MLKQNGSGLCDHEVGTGKTLIMCCAVMEMSRLGRASKVRQLFASLLSIALIAVGLFFYNWQLTLALFWVVPLAMAIILVSKKKMNRLNRDYYQTKRDVSEHIQEGLECVREIKAYNREPDYLDEATASLDVENETRIQAGISELIRNKTVLVIAHRMRTVVNADKIVVLDNVVVAESGSPEELLAAKGIFAGMTARQDVKKPEI